MINMDNLQGTSGDVRYEGDRFLKVTPNLFTQERLHLFDSLELYTSLMKCSKSIEQGERLHNLSWRIVNKALLKDGDVNKSKKRDGVKNLYYVVAPGKSNGTPGVSSQPAQATQAAVPRVQQQVQPVQQQQQRQTTAVSPSKPAPAAARPPVSLFGKRDQTFYSSEDEGSDWDRLSESASSDEEGNYDDEEEEESYYRNQWDKLLEKQPPPAVVPQQQQEPLKKSLLSGLFLNEQNRASKSGGTTTIPPATAVPAKATSTSTSTSTSNVTALGSVTTPQGSLATAVPTAALYGQNSNSRGSFSSIVSESTRERYLHESNAPPAAQTILPRALSTHMFLPNNVHQQRLAAAISDNDTDKSPSQSPPLQAPLRKVERRTSMDIPGKKNGFFKTRMEIVEEERLSRASRRKL